MKKRKFIKLELGSDYSVGFGVYDRHIVDCKFIQVTEKGFNLLNLKTNKCILKRHLYISKYSQHQDGTWFCIDVSVRVIKISKFETNQTF